MWLNAGPTSGGVIMDKDYLGDSVYAQHDGYHIILTTENGYPDDPRNQIALEPNVLAALTRYVERIKAQYAEKTP
jgi:hypothetical protein